MEKVTSPRPSPQCGEGVDRSEFSEIELVAGDAEVFDDVRDDAAWYIARMPGEGNQTVGTKGIRVMPVTAGGAFMHTTDLTQAAVKLPTVPRRVFAHRSGGENEFVAEGRWDGAARFEQCFQMRLGGLLKAEHGFTPITTVGVAAGQERRFRNPNAVFVLTKSHFRERNNHGAATVTRQATAVKRTFDA